MREATTVARFICDLRYSKDIAKRAGHCMRNRVMQQAFSFATKVFDSVRNRSTAQGCFLVRFLLRADFRT